MRDYLPEATNFQGMPKLSKREYWNAFREKSVECPVCKGHGGWNIRLDAYGPGKHFQSHCSQCNGWGYVGADSLDATCIHEDREISHSKARRLGVITWGMFCHVYQCKKCKRLVSHDSSG